MFSHNTSAPPCAGDVASEKTGAALLGGQSTAASSLAFSAANPMLAASNQLLGAGAGALGAPADQFIGVAGQMYYPSAFGGAASQLGSTALASSNPLTAIASQAANSSTMGAVAQQWMQAAADLLSSNTRGTTATAGFNGASAGLGTADLLAQTSAAQQVPTAQASAQSLVPANAKGLRDWMTANARTNSLIADAEPSGLAGTVRGQASQLGASGSTAAALGALDSQGVAGTPTRKRKYEATAGANGKDHGSMAGTAGQAPGVNGLGVGSGAQDAGASPQPNKKMRMTAATPTAAALGAAQQPAASATSQASMTDYDSKMALYSQALNAQAAGGLASAAAYPTNAAAAQAASNLAALSGFSGMTAGIQPNPLGSMAAQRLLRLAGLQNLLQQLGSQCHAAQLQNSALGGQADMTSANALAQLQLAQAQGSMGAHAGLGAGNPLASSTIRDTLGLNRGYF